MFFVFASLQKDYYLDNFAQTFILMTMGQAYNPIVTVQYWWEKTTFWWFNYILGTNELGFLGFAYIHP